MGGLDAAIYCGLPYSHTRHVLVALETANAALSRVDLQATAGFTDREHFVTEHLKPLVDIGVVEMTIHGKPRSSKQKYRLTEKGRAVLNEIRAPTPQ